MGRAIILPSIDEICGPRKGRPVLSNRSDANVSSSQAVLGKMAIAW